GFDRFVDDERHIAARGLKAGERPRLGIARLSAERVERLKGEFCIERASAEIVFIRELGVEFTGCADRFTKQAQLRRSPRVEIRSRLPVDLEDRMSAKEIEEDPLERALEIEEIRLALLEEASLGLAHQEE